MTTLGSLTSPRGTDGVSVGPLDMNPFVDEDMLSGAQVVEVRLDAIRSLLSVVLELRVSEGHWEAGAGLLVAEEVHGFSWSQEDRGHMETAWTALSSSPRGAAQGLALRLSGTPTFSLSFIARRATFFTSQIERLEGTAPPDYGEIEASASHPDIPNWNSAAACFKAAYYP